MACFIDSGVWIASFNKRDEHHEQGKAIIQAVTQKRLRNSIISDYIFDEVVTYIRKKIGSVESVETANSLLDSPNVKLVFIDDTIFQASYHIFQKYEMLSFTDATTIVIMKNLKMKDLFSFDAGFDGIKDISRRSEFLE